MEVLRFLVILVIIGSAYVLGGAVATYFYTQERRESDIWNHVGQLEERLQRERREDVRELNQRILDLDMQLNRRIDETVRELTEYQRTKTQRECSCK